MTPILQLTNITKRFPGVLANDHINLELNQGEILALLGENGAGKTTLMNILYGLYQPDEGEILVRGEKITVHSPTDAINAGIGMVHQHFMLIPVFTVTENVMLGQEEANKLGFLNQQPDDLRVVVEGAAVLKRIEQALLQVVEVAPTSVWWIRLNRHGQ